MEELPVMSNKIELDNRAKIMNTAFADDKYPMDNEPVVARPRTTASAPMTKVHNESEKKKSVDDVSVNLSSDEQEKAKPEKQEKVKPEKQEKAKPEKQEKAKPEKQEKAKPEKQEKAKPEKQEKAKPEKQEKVKPEKQEKPKPEKQEKPKPEKQEKAKPEKQEKAKPEKQEMPKPVKQEKPKPVKQEQAEKKQVKIVLPLDEEVAAAEPVAASTVKNVPENVGAAEKAKSGSGIGAFFKKLFGRKRDGSVLLNGGIGIKGRILRLCIISVCAAVVVTQLFSIISTFTSFDKSYTDQAQALAASYAQTVKAKLAASDTADLSAALGSISEGKNVVVLDKDGMVVAAANVPIADGTVSYKNHEKGGYVKLAEAMMSNGTGTIRYNVDGVEYLAAYCPVELSDGWSVAASLDYSSAASGIVINMLIAIGIALLVIVMTCVVCIRTSDRISKPVTEAAKRLKLLSQGDITTEFDVEVSNKGTR